MKELTTEIKDLESFYIVMEDDSNDVLNDDGELLGSYDYKEWSSIGKLVFSALYDCKTFDTRDSAEAAAVALREQYGTDFTVLEIVKSVATLYTLN